MNGRGYLDSESLEEVPGRPVAILVRASLASSFFMSLFAWRSCFLDFAVL